MLMKIMMNVLFIAQTFGLRTVTKTKTIYHVKTYNCNPTKIPIPTFSPPLKNSHQDECLRLFNNFRRSINLPLFESAPQSEIECANRAAINDAKIGYHHSFLTLRMCPNARSQCECMKGVNGGGLENCIKAYISEGPPGTIGMYPEQNHGHYKIISGNFKQVACGTDNNGFFTHNFY